MTVSRQELGNGRGIGIQIETVKIIDMWRENQLQCARRVADFQRPTKAPIVQQSEALVDALAKQPADGRLAIVRDRIGRPVLSDCLDQRLGKALHSVMTIAKWKS